MESARPSAPQPAREAEKQLLSPECSTTASDSSPRSPVCLRRRRSDAPAVVRQEAVVQCPGGRVAITTLRPPGAGPFPAAVVSVACYSSLPPQLEQVEGAFFVKHGYAYVVTRQVGPVEDIADAVFVRFRGDAGAILDWLGEQPWFDGRVGTHGMSLVGSMAYATMTASADPDAPPNRPKVRGAVCTISFSRVWPTLFLWGHGFAAELAARFLWVAERPPRDGKKINVRALWGLGCFFGLRDWPGLWSISNSRTAKTMDRALWGRENALWQAGIRYRSPEEPFWRNGVDVQCDLSELAERRPPLHIITGWFDVFIRQGMDDFVEAEAASPGQAQLTVCNGGHFKVAYKYSDLVLTETLAVYEESVRGADRAEARERLGLEERKAVRLELCGAPIGQHWLECDAWPPKPAGSLEWFLRADERGDRVGRLGPDPPASESALAYTYDPHKPTPYIGGGWLNLRREGHLDQSALEGRSDVLVCTTPELCESVDIVGEVTATLFVSSTALECDFLVRLCVVPAAAAGRSWWGSGRGGGQGSLNLIEGITRVKFGAGCDGHEEVRQVEVNLGPLAYHFKKGERIRVHVCSAAHPKLLRHPLSEDDWMAGSGPLGPPARQRVLVGGAAASVLKLPIRGPDVQTVPHLSRFEGSREKGAKNVRQDDPVGGSALPGMAQWQ